MPLEPRRCNGYLGTVRANSGSVPKSLFEIAAQPCCILGKSLATRSGRDGNLSGYVVAVALVCCILASACGERVPDKVTVSGKTVYRGMALEEVRIEVLRKEQGTWISVAKIRSGYHGSFVVRLEPGEYALRAATEITAGQQRSHPVTGSYPLLEVPTGVRRLDQVRIEMRAGAGAEPLSEGEG